MTNHSVLRTARLALCSVLGTITLSSMLSCSLVLDFEQCQTDKDCTAIGQCIDNVCQEAERESITAHIVSDTTWTADKTYILEDIIMIVRPAVLTIEPGTKILAKRGAGLVSQAGAKLVADGTRERPIVFTSADPVGRRTAGNWAGLAMVGYAKTNRFPFDLRITPGEYDTNVGGDDDTWDCGTLRYVRVEFGGAEVNGQKALKGVTLAGCGSKTTIEYVQSHMSDDDGWAVFGGTVNLRHVVATRPRDDGFDFDTGWRGTAQFVAVQQDVGSAEGLEIENVAEKPDGIPQTDARVYNFTIIGGGPSAGSRQVGMFFRHGGLGTFSHGIITGFKSSGLYIDGQHAADHALDGKINIQNTIFHNLGPDGETYFDAEPFTEWGENRILEDYTHFEQEDANNLFGVDPGLKDPHSLTNPGWVPSGQNITGVPAPPEGFDPIAVYRGAFAPNQIPWTEGWTAYPLN